MVTLQLLVPRFCIVHLFLTLRNRVEYKCSTILL